MVGILNVFKKIVKVVLPYGIVMLFKKHKKKFPGSREYWENRYAKGGNSGAGSYNRLAVFKSEVINDFVEKNKVQTVIEFGCGDGNQLSLAEYPKYTGFDVSETSIKLCRNRFKEDNSKEFLLLEEYRGFHKAELVLSLDVIYHLIEDKVFEEYIQNLFQTATNFVIIYSCDYDSKGNNFHTKPRKFTKYIENNVKDWNLIEHIPNKYPHDKKNRSNTSRSDFFIYTKKIKNKCRKNST